MGLLRLRWSRKEVNVTMGWYENLKTEDKNIIRMYTTARQFRNAILPTEYLLFSPGKTRNRTIPYVVNRSFSCELYLKTVLCIQGAPHKKMHSIIDLLEATTLKENFTTYVLEGVAKTGKQYSKEQLDQDLRSISDAFVNVRYVYEHDFLHVAVGCLEILNDYLDDYCRKSILEKYGVDMNEHQMI